MQTVVAGDTTPLHWQVVDADTKAPVDITDATINVKIRPKGKTSPIIEVTGTKTDAAIGKWSHLYPGIAVGLGDKNVWEMQAKIVGPPGTKTAPTEQNALILVREGF